MRSKKQDIGCVTVIIAFILTAVLAGVSFKRNEIWATELSLCGDAVLKAPNKPRPHENLGNYYRLQGKYDEAIREYTKTVALDKSYLAVYDGFFFMARMLDSSGRWQQAIGSYAVICENAPARFQRAKDIACERAEQLNRKIKCKS
jgi:tetratricopeptide (TPR) repeat protein